MEILLLVVFIAVIIFVTAFKARLSDNLKMIITLLSGSILLIWFWANKDGLIYWKIIVTVVVLGSVLTTLRAIKKNKKEPGFGA